VTSLARDSASIAALLLLGACAAIPAARRPADPAAAAPGDEAPPPRSEAAPRTQPEGVLGTPPQGALVTEELGGERDQAEPVLPPDPTQMLASIQPDTPPRRVTSLRLTEEGRRLLEAGDTVQALDRVEKAVRVDPSNPHGYYWLAQIHQRTGRPDQALPFADKSIALFASGDRGWLAQAYIFRASILESVGHFPEARDSYRLAARVQPGNVAAQAGLARLGASGTVP
jgi:hypothetical protein